MLSTRLLCRQPSSRDPFRTPCWDDQHPAFLRIDATLPADHHARWLRSVVNRLDLKPLRLSYANRGSQAYLPELLLAFVLFMYSQGFLSPAQWAEFAQYDDRAKWLLRGCGPHAPTCTHFATALSPFSTPGTNNSSTGLSRRESPRQPAVASTAHSWPPWPRVISS